MVHIEGVAFPLTEIEALDCVVSNPSTDTLAIRLILNSSPIDFLFPYLFSLCFHLNLLSALQ